MRLPILLTLILTLTCPVFAQDEAPATKPTTPRDKVSYAIGMTIGRNIKQQGLPLNVQMIALGISTILQGKEPLVSQEEIQAASTEFDKVVEAEAMKPVNEFLAANGKKEGIVTTKSGLQYKVLEVGTGETPTAASKVTTHYRGTLMDGKVFDESYKGEAPTAADEPVSFPVGGVIKGWTEALQLMKVGAKYRLFIPPGLAYGKNGPPSIGPNKLLIFDIQLLATE